MEKIKAVIIMWLLATSSLVYADQTWYTITSVYNNKEFAIGDHYYTAQDYCFGVRKGDKVAFTQGAPSAYCTTAQFKVQRNDQICNVTCH